MEPEVQVRSASAGALPGGARTPEEALDQLRRVLARRSYAGVGQCTGDKDSIGRDGGNSQALVDGNRRSRLREMNNRRGQRRNMQTCDSDT